MKQQAGGRTFVPAGAVAFAALLAVGAARAQIQGTHVMDFVNDPASRDVTCKNVRIAPRDPETATITVDLAWRPSWRNGENHDAAWIFFKVRAEGATDWQHVRLKADRVLNPPGYGCAQSNKKMDFLVPDGADGFTGLFIRRATQGSKSSVDMQGVTAVWDLAGTPGITPETKVQVGAFGLIMVYVSEGPYFLGSGGTESYGFYQYTDGKQVAMPYRVTHSAAIPTGKQAGQLWARGAEPQDGGEIPSTFPNGYGAFYCAYNPLSGSQYTHFLNLLTPEQATERYHASPEDVGPGKTTGHYMPWTGEIHRTGTSSNYTYKFVHYRPDARMKHTGIRWLSWADSAAYMAWAGLRPMTELEYEKAMRGPRRPIPDEAHNSYYEIPTRGVGQSGRPRERTVTAATIEGWSPATFLATHGLGTVTLPADWPQANAVGIGFRGGYFNGYDGDALGGMEFSRTSNRKAAALVDAERRGGYGIRAVRTAPPEAARYSAEAQ
ncbi:MAG: hypothetical protein FJ222_02715 [Lentisphaerae bacterium]|nr:hypothetical protein [Lentisphaerota bacterium]